MTVATETNQIIAIADGVQVVFPYDFLVFLETDLTVEVGVDLIDPADYTVDGLGDEFGGTVTFLVAPGVDLPVTITRTLPLTQATDYRPFDPFPAETHEKALDRLTMITQQLAFDIEQGLADIQFLGNWETAVVYTVNDMVQFPDELGSYYLCLIQHTSGTFQQDLDAGFWVLFIDLELILESTQICVDSAAAALVSETNAAASESAAAVSAAEALASEQAAALSASQADASAQAALISADAASASQDFAFLWASEAEDVPVNDGTNPQGFSSFHWSEKAEGIVQAGGVQPVAANVINLTTVFHDDINVMDFTGHPQSDVAGGNPTQLLIEVFMTLDCGYTGDVYRFFGGKPRNIGLGAPATAATDWFQVATTLASGISYIPEDGTPPFATNVQAALSELGNALSTAVPIGIVLPCYLAVAPPGFAFELGETLGNAGSGADFAGDQYEEAFDIFNQVQPNPGTAIFANGDTVVLPTAPAFRRVMVSKGSGDDLGDTGGSNEHTLTLAESPAHDHGGVTDDPGSHTHQLLTRFNPPDGNVSGTGRAMESSVGSTGQMDTQSNGSHTHAIPSEGGGNAHSVEQSFIVTTNIIKISD